MNIKLTLPTMDYKDDSPIQHVGYKVEVLDLNNNELDSKELVLPDNIYIFPTLKRYDELNIYLTYTFNTGLSYKVKLNNNETDSLMDYDNAIIETPIISYKLTTWSITLSRNDVRWFTGDARNIKNTEYRVLNSFDKLNSKTIKTDDSPAKFMQEELTVAIVKCKIETVDNDKSLYSGDVIKLKDYNLNELFQMKNNYVFIKEHNITEIIIYDPSFFIEKVTLKVEGLEDVKIDHLLTEVDGKYILHLDYNTTNDTVDMDHRLYIEFVNQYDEKDNVMIDLIPMEKPFIRCINMLHYNPKTTVTTLATSNNKFRDVIKGDILYKVIWENLYIYKLNSDGTNQLLRNITLPNLVRNIDTPYYIDINEENILAVSYKNNMTSRREVNLYKITPDNIIEIKNEAYIESHDSDDIGFLTQPVPLFFKDDNLYIYTFKDRNNGIIKALDLTTYNTTDIRTIPNIHNTVNYGDLVVLCNGFFITTTAKTLTMFDLNKLKYFEIPDINGILFGSAKFGSNKFGVDHPVTHWVSYFNNSELILYSEYEYNTLIYKFNLSSGDLTRLDFIEDKLSNVGMGMDNHLALLDMHNDNKIIMKGVPNE